jgi:dTDP-4-dehydrorhamnose 3,5-epimerase-like enzyme
LRWDDLKLNIKWPLQKKRKKKPILSKRDR